MAKEKRKRGSPVKRRRNVKCFNCGGPHLVYECDVEDFDPDRVDENRRESARQFESRREEQKLREDRQKVGKWSLKILPDNQSTFDKTVDIVLEVASDEHVMIESDDDPEFCLVTGMEDEEEMNKIKKELENPLPRKVKVEALGRFAAKSINHTKETASSGMTRQEIKRVDRLEEDMNLVKTDLARVKTMQTEMHTHMGKMQTSIEDLATKKDHDGALLRSLAKKLLSPEEIPQTPIPKNKKMPSKEDIVQETPDDVNMADPELESPMLARRLSMENITQTPLTHIGLKRHQPSPGARLGSKGFLHIPPLCTIPEQ